MSSIEVSTIEEIVPCFNSNKMKELKKIVLCLLLMNTLVLCEVCDENAFTPVFHPGPSLSIPLQFLSRSLTCQINPNEEERNRILFIPGTGVEKAPDQYNYAWTKQMTLDNYSFCLVDIPDYGLGDAQISSEFVVHSIRQMFEESSKRRINVICHSQGCALTRWALRFWPDVRSMIEHVIGLAPAYHSIDGIPNECSRENRCIPARWQFLHRSSFMCALNSYQETFDQIFYTQILTQYDQSIQPIQSAQLPSGSNILVQQICSNNRIDHLGISLYDRVAYLITMDAFIHHENASLQRILHEACPNESCCSDLYMNSFNQSLINQILNEVFILNSFIEHYPRIDQEPILKCYTMKRCLFQQLSSSSLPNIMDRSFLYFSLFFWILSIQ